MQRFQQSSAETISRSASANLSQSISAYQAQQEVLSYTASAAFSASLFVDLEAGC